jgi:hypothetical protein
MGIRSERDAMTEKIIECIIAVHTSPSAEMSFGIPVPLSKTLKLKPDCADCRPADCGRE